MDLNFGIPTPAEILTDLALYVAPLILVVGLARLIYARSKRQVVIVVAAVLALVSASTIALISLSFIYPHHHHDTRWIAGRYDLNYPIDAMIGIGLLAILILTWRTGSRRSVAGS